MEEVERAVRRPARPATSRRRVRAAWMLGVVVTAAGIGSAIVWLTAMPDSQRVSSAETGEPRDSQPGGGTDGDRPAPTDGATTSSTEASTTTTLRDPVLGNGESVTLAFAGDTHFEGAVADRLASDPASVFGPVIPVLSGADVTVVNMETALGVGGSAVPKEFTFQASAQALEAFRAAGVDVVSAANNHGMDFGPESLEETLAAEALSGFPVIGIGRNEQESYEPFTAEVRGQRIAVIAATQVLDASLLEQWTAGPDQAGLASAKRVDRLVSEVQAARSVADTVVVFLHWGIEGHTCPSSTQRELASQLVAAGADVIVGGHAHRIQGAGRLGTAVVNYGLGNFVFNAGSAESARTGVFTVTVTGRRIDGYEWTPARIVDRQPQPLAGPDADAALEYWESLRACTGLTP